MELSSLNEVRLIVLIKETNNFDEINNFFMNNYWNKIEIFVKLMWKVSMRWKNWSDFKGLHSIHFREENWSKIETLSLNSRPRFRNYRMKLIVWMIREILKMLNQYAADNPTLPVNMRFQSPGGVLSRSLGMPRRNDRPPSIWDTHVVSGTVFANPTASSSAPCQQESNPWGSHESEHTSPHVMSESQTPAQDQKCQSGPSAKKSVIFSGVDSSKNYGADQQRLQISDLHSNKFPNPATFACWKIRFKTEVLVHNFLRRLCCGSKKWRWLIQWMISNLRVLI